MSEFLERVQRASGLRDPDRTLEAVRGVFYALLLGAGNGQVRDAAEGLPEELETLWKPALFACLRQDGEARAPAGSSGRDAREDFVDRVRRQAPDLDGEDVEEVARAVLRELRPRLSPDARSRLIAAVPDGMRDDWTG